METIYGIHATETLLRVDPQRIEQLFVQSGRDDARSREIHRLAEAGGVPVRTVTRDEMNQLAPGSHQGVMARVEPAVARPEAWLKSALAGLDEPAFLLVLDSVTDPHNLGACLRSAEAAGVHAVIVPKDNSAGLSPVVRKVACGAAELVPLVSVTNLARALRGLQQLGIWLVGADGEATQSIHQLDCRGPIAIVMGAEGSGMRRLTRECCDHLAGIPMRGSMASLNVSVATGICLFEVLRQRGE